MVLSNGGYRSNDIILLYHLLWREARTVEDLVRILPLSESDKANYTAALRELSELATTLRDGALS